MTEAAKTVLTAYEVRKTKQQKEAFRTFLCEELEKLGYAPRVESGRVLVMNHNVVAGDPERAKVLFTAHYDTCAVLPFPNFITPRNFFVYLLYQLAIAADQFAFTLAVACGGGHAQILIRLFLENIGFLIYTMITKHNTQI